MNERRQFEKAVKYEPNLEQLAARISRRVRRSRREILAVLRTINFDKLTQTEQRRIIREIERILNGLDETFVEEVPKIIDEVYTHGRAKTLVALGLFPSIRAATKHIRSQKAKTSHAHRQFKSAIVETTMEDLLAMTQNTRRRVKAEVRRVAAEVFRLDEAVTSQRRDMTRRLHDAGIFAIRDAAGRRWSIENYTDVVIVTKMTQAHKEATMQEALEQGAGYVVVSEHGDSCPKCEPWEGHLLRIDDSVPGDEPTLDDAIAEGLMHPGCKHTVTPIRNPDVVPDWVVF